MLKRLGTAAASLAIVVMAAAPASAADYDFTITNGWTGAHGGRVLGSLAFQSKHKFTWNMSVADLCDSAGAGDGFGVYVYFNLWRANGFTEATGVVAKDTNGCGNGWSADSGNVTRTDITLAGTWVRAYLGDNGEPMWYAQSTLKTNPYVP